MSVRFHALTCTDLVCDPGCDIGDPDVIGGKVTLDDVGGIFGPGWKVFGLDWKAGLDDVDPPSLSEDEWNLVGRVCDKLDEVAAEIPIEVSQRLAMEIIALVRSYSRSVDR